MVVEIDLTLDPSSDSDNAKSNGLPGRPQQSSSAKSWPFPLDSGASFTERPSYNPHHLLGSRSPISPPPIRRTAASILSPYGYPPPDTSREPPPSQIQSTNYQSTSVPAFASLPAPAPVSAPPSRPPQVLEPSRSPSPKLLAVPASFVLPSQAQTQASTNPPKPALFTSKILAPPSPAPAAASVALAVSASTNLSTRHVNEMTPTSAVDVSSKVAQQLRQTGSQQAAQEAVQQVTKVQQITQKAPHQSPQQVPQQAHQQVPQQMPEEVSQQQLKASSTPERRAREQSTKDMTPVKPEWDVRKMVQSLSAFRQDVKDDHARLVTYIIDSVKPKERRPRSGTDLFANISKNPITENSEILRIKIKQHIKNRKDHREVRCPVVCVKTHEERVPTYRNPHVETRKNILTRGTMLTFVPHVRDLDKSEEAKYNRWLNELEEIDRKSGFKPMNREEKVAFTIKNEIAATISLYLDGWLEKLSIPNCTKSSLMMCAMQQETFMTPQQKSDVLKSYPEANNFATVEARKTAERFFEAFNRVFSQEQPNPRKQIELRDVLLLDDSVDSVLDSKPNAKDGSSSQDEIHGDIGNYLGTYWNLGCNVCFSHSCDHGDYDVNNRKATFSMPGRLQDFLRHRKQRKTDEPAVTNGNHASVPCHRQCYLTHTTLIESSDITPWSHEERMVLRAITTAAADSKTKKDPVCLAADLLSRDCCDVFKQFEELDIPQPPEEPHRKPQIRTLSWYDRYKKCLIGDWQDHTVSHEHQQRDTPEPCSHDGPCTQETCSCVQRGLLCEKFCDCTAECCAYKFTGCACNSLGRSCVAKQKDRPCICIQLNRECDPDLCGTCGIVERADPANAHDDVLHATGCQNCDLQRGVFKTVVLGRSQLQFCGYGLYTAVDIAQDDFVIEYVGELITHDEGVRREARRGDVFGGKENSVSYVFTLLENEGIWVDAASFGNLSRYINHAAESDTRGCNITPRIVYVNGEFRIKFTALRNIEAGEELFFNYGKNFPNLTEKLLDEKESGRPAQSRKPGRRPRQAEEAGVARKAPKAEKKKKAKVKQGTSSYGFDEDTTMDDWTVAEITKPSRKRKRVQDDSEEEEYRPKGGPAVNTPAESPSTFDSDDPLGNSMQRLRRRRRPKVEVDKARGQPKTRGKRGGARPGSGRPRKHPRPVPKAAPPTPTPTATVIEEHHNPEPKPMVPEVPPPALEQAIQTPVEMEIEDSEISRLEEMEASIRPPEVDAYEMGDEVEDDEYDDDDDDQDVVVRKRMDRAMRNRRPPAKFRNDELWEMSGV